MITVEIQYQKKSGELTTDDEISRIFVVSETEHAVILHVETETKYPEPILYGSCWVSFYTKIGNVAKIKVNGIPSDTEEIWFIIAEPSRYGLHVVLFHDVPENAKLVYESEKWKNL